MRKKARGDIRRDSDMAVDLDARVADLGVATKQMVEIAKALSFDSRILILDEPTAALTNKEVDTLFETIRKLKAHGVSMLYISHRLDEIFQIADRVTVIRDGEHIQTEEVSQVTKDQLVSWMVGRTLTNLYPKEDLRDRRGGLRGARHRAGGGPQGHRPAAAPRGDPRPLGARGRRAAPSWPWPSAASRAWTAGQILIDGKRVHFSNYRQAMDNGIVYISEDRQKYGLVVPMTISVNITLPLLARISRVPGIIDTAAERRDQRHLHGEAWPSRHPTATSSSTTSPAATSRRSRWPRRWPRRPGSSSWTSRRAASTWGQRARSTASSAASRRTGKSIIMISSDLPEIIGMSDRVLVMKNGLQDGRAHAQRALPAEDPPAGPLGKDMMKQSASSPESSSWDSSSWPSSGYMSLTTSFSSRNGLFSMMLDVSPTIVGAIAMSLVIFTGNIDISAGTILGFVSFTAGELAADGVPMILFVPAAILVGHAPGGAQRLDHRHLQGPLHRRDPGHEHGPPRASTPRSCATRGGSRTSGTTSPWFGRGLFFGIVPYIFVVPIVVAALFIFIMRYSRFGKSLYAVGGNRQAAIYAGINPDSTVIKVYLVEGLLLGIAGLLKAMTRSDVLPSSFQGREMTFIAAAVVGGVNIMGGSGKLIGAVFGALLVYLLSTAMIYMGFQDYYQFALQGVIILIAVFITVTDFAPCGKRARQDRPGAEGS